jgi:hypothetical protein
MFRQKTVIILAISAIMAIAIACGAAAEPTATPVPPTSTPVPTPVPTSTPVPIVPIEIDWETNAVGFFESLPESESSCAADALGGRERVLSMLESNLGSERLTPAEAEALDACLSDETIRAIFIGALSREAGSLSDATIVCIGEKIGGMSAASLFLDEPAADVIISSLQGVFCLNHDERAAVSSSEAMYGFGELGGIDALECVVNGVGPTGLEDLMALASSGDIDIAAIGDLLPLAVECGVIEDETFHDLGITADQIGCMLAELGEDGLALLDPTAAEPDISDLSGIFAALGTCEIEIEDLLGSGVLPIDPGALTDPTATIDAVEIPTVVIALPDSLPDDLADLDLPFTDEQLACLITEIGEDEINKLLAGGVPDFSLFAALATCEIDLAVLLGG